MQQERGLITVSREKAQRELKTIQRSPQAEVKYFLLIFFWLQGKQLTMTFWNDKTLAQMTTDEWEQLCDGCGKCCLNKLIDDDTDELYTDAACKLLDRHGGHCRKYEQRFQAVLGVPSHGWEYRWINLVAYYLCLSSSSPWTTTTKLAPFTTGSKDKMHELEMSTQDKVVCESTVKDIEAHIVTCLWQKWNKI